MCVVFTPHKYVENRSQELVVCFIEMIAAWLLGLVVAIYSVLNGARPDKHVVC